ncbi:pimeloyl-ACP methyl ester carboxylesterase [Saccharopolyspora spinosa]|uniref:Pimeloyl-ACP methyl ester carboxylesterase n=2 Tax=Saccharopolyspora spinosa TaxID=60894 RepID=A0A2N3Y3H2_SACSN|nr:pimeloyl-ACP methyl ester carboxylesterase [Saccharopolyspora spinosa]
MGFRTSRSAEDFFAAYDAVLAKWPIPVDGLDVPTAFGSTRVHACGARDGNPLVLLHGGGATSTTWFANVGQLGERHRVYAIDLIGDPGRSVADGEAVTCVGDQIAWLDEVLDHLGVEKTDLCGHSYGAWIALHYAIHSPRVRRLALLDPTACFARWNPRYLLRALPMLLRPSPRRTRDFLRWEADGTGIDPDCLELQARGADFPAARLITRPNPNPTRLTIPMLVLAAENSKAHNANRLIEQAERLVSDVRAALLPAVGHHALPAGNAARLNEILVDFLDGR